MKTARAGVGAALARRPQTYPAIPDVDFEWLDDLGDELAASPASLAVESPCELLDAHRVLLARGILYDRHHEAGSEWASIRLSAPGRVIQRCLIDGQRVILLVTDDGREQAAEVDRLAFDPAVGRVCVLRFVDGGLM